MKKSIAIAAWMALTCGAAGMAHGQAQRIPGDIVAVEGSALTLKPATGEPMRLPLPANVRVTLRSPADWAQIRQGSYVGTTAVPQPDGTLLAKEVHIFTEQQRGTSEGHYPMQTPGDTMTNATVSTLSQARRDTMTNATVASATGPGDAHRMTLTYKGGEKTVVVPQGTPVITSEPGDRSALVPGAHAVIYAQRAADGTLGVERISVGKNGYTPPI
jgi:hypothetical protein